MSRLERMGTLGRDERGSDVVEFVVLTAIVLLLAGAVLLQLVDEAGQMFLRAILLHLH